MAMMMGTLYEALVEGGASADTAKRAAEEVADHQKQLSDIRTDLAVVKSLLGILIAGVAALILKAFFG
jgi:hypothetical protein